jgi:hypothetical protein
MTEMDRAYSTHRRDEKCTQNVDGKIKLTGSKGNKL